MCCGLPVAIICLLLCYVPFLCYSSHWEDAADGNSITLAVQSQFYRYTLVASIAASIPPLIDLLFHIITIDRSSSNRYLSALSLLFCLVAPELVLLIFVTPKANTRLFICNHYAQLILSLLATSQFLCRYGKSYWKNKFFTSAVCLIYIGTSMGSFVPYFHSDIRLIAQYSVFFIQSVGISIFLLLAYKYLTLLKSNKPAEGSTVDSVDDEFFCKYIIYCMLFVIFGLMFLDFSIKLEYWTQYNSIVLSYIIFLMTIPSLSMCMILTQATRNQAYFTQKIKVMFVRYISHEMRTPLNTATMGLQYLRSELIKANTNTELVDILDEVRGACEISVTILNEMLDFDKLQSGLMKLEVEEIPVKDFLNTVISPFHVYARQKDIQLVCDDNKPELDSLLITADRNKFAQVIRNLISNALKFTPSEGYVTVMATVMKKTITKTNTTTTNNKKNRGGGKNDTTGPDNKIGGGDYILRIDVVDTGVGVSKENQSKLFREIVQFSPGKLQSGGGSGLGLYISKGIMDLHQGSLSIASEGEGFGCTFTVELEATYTSGYLSLDEYKENDNTTTTTTTTNRGIGPLRRFSRLTNMVSMIKLYHNFLSTRSYTSGIRKISPDVADIEVFAPLPPIPSPPRPLSASRHLSRSMKMVSYAVCQSFSDPEVESDPVLLKVLVVDDSVSNRKMLVRLVRDKCCVIVEAVDGVDAVNKMRTAIQPSSSSSAVDYSLSLPVLPVSLPLPSPQPFDVVLMDYVMPNMEGPEAAHCMRELGYLGLIIGITGNVLPSDKERFISQGANIVLTKPVDIRDINNAFQTILTKDKR